MKSFIAILSLGLCLTASAAPILQFDFSQGGASQQSTGTLPMTLTTYRAASTPADYITSTSPASPSVSNGNVLNFTPENLQGNKASAMGSITSDPSFAPLTSGLGSFTVTAWVSNLSAKTDRRRLFFLSGGSTRAIDIFFSAGTNGNVISLAVAGSATENPERIVTSAPSVYVPNESAEWYFVAVSYDATTGATVFYVGAQDSLLANSQRTLLNAQGGVYTMPVNSTSLNVGNSSVGAAGSFDGLLSDVRFYGEVLDSQAIDALHAVPEPSTAMVLGLGLGVMAICKLGVLFKLGK